MRFPRLIRRFLYRQGWERNTYEELLTTPVGRMFTCQLSLALRSGASRVTLGTPPSVPLTDTLKQEIRCDQQTADANFEADILSRLDGQQVGTRQPESSHAIAIRESASPRHRDGWPDIPFWYCVEDIWCRIPGTPVHLHAYLIGHVMDRLVSIDATTENPKPVKWIEYSPSPGSKDERRFVEVDLLVEDNGSFTIEFKATRTEPYNVRVSRYAAGG